MERIAETFAQTFASWRLKLPVRALRDRKRGEILRRGWWVQYLFGQDDHGEYVQYYSQNRMTDDAHVRLYASGRIEELPVIQSAYWTSSDVHEAAHAREEYIAANRAVATELQRLGFGLGLNALLRCSPADV